MGAVSFTLTENVGPCHVKSIRMVDEHLSAPTYIIGDRGNILKARKEADLVWAGIFIRYTDLILGSPKLSADTKALTMDTCTPPEPRSDLLGRI